MTNSEVDAVVWLFSGAILCVLLLSLPKKFFVFLTKTFTIFTPNLVTVLRLPLIYAGIYLLFFTQDYHFIGYLFIVFGIILDRLDGKHAMALDEAIARGEKGLPVGRTDTGSWLDPLVDKLTLLPLFLMFTLQDILSSYMFVVMVLLELVSTLIRAPFNLFSSIVKTSTATGVGKLKALFMILTIFSCLPYSVKWVESEPCIPHLLFSVSLIFAGLSIVSRFSLNKKLERFISSLTDCFSHKEAD